MNEIYIKGIRVLQHIYDQTYGANTDAVCVDSNDIKKSIEVAREIGSQELALIGEYQLNNLNFIEAFDLSFVKSVSIAKQIVDFSPLYSIGSQITHLTFDSKKAQEIDLCHFPNLEFLGCQWRQNILSLNKCIKIQRIKISKFNFKDLQKLSDLVNLEKVELHGSSLINLEGISKWRKLKMLVLHQSRKLTSLDGFNEEMKSLESLSIVGAPKLHDIDTIGLLSNLRKLHIGKAKNIRSLVTLNSLNTVDFLVVNPANVKVDDSDFGPVERLKERSGLDD